MRKTEQHEKTGGYEKNDLTASQCDLLEAKLRFAKAVDTIDPLSVVRKRPFLSTACAFLLGFGLTSLSRKKLASTTMLPLIFQAGDIAMRFFLNSRK